MQDKTKKEDEKNKDFRFFNEKTEPPEKDKDKEKIPEKSQPEKESENKEPLKEPDEKTYSRSEIEEIIAAVKEQFSDEYRQRAEETAAAGMSPEERARFYFEKERKAFMTEKEEYLKEKSLFQTAKILEREGLPIEFADFLSDSDEKKVMKNIAAFKSAFSKALEKAVEDKMRGNIPKTTPSTESDAFLDGFNRKF